MRPDPPAPGNEAQSSPMRRCRARTAARAIAASAKRSNVSAGAREGVKAMPRPWGDRVPFYLLAVVGAGLMACAGDPGPDGSGAVARRPGVAKVIVAARA